MWSYLQFGPPAGPKISGRAQSYRSYRKLHPPPRSRPWKADGWMVGATPVRPSSWLPLFHSPPLPSLRPDPTGFSGPFMKNGLFPEAPGWSVRPPRPDPTGFSGPFMKNGLFPEAPEWSARPLPTGSDRFFRAFHEKRPFPPSHPTATHRPRWGGPHPTLAAPSLAAQGCTPIMAIRPA